MTANVAKENCIILLVDYTIMDDAISALLRTSPIRLTLFGRRT